MSDKKETLSNKQSFVSYEFIDGRQNKVIWRREEGVKELIERIKKRLDKIIMVETPFKDLNIKQQLSSIQEAIDKEARKELT